MLKLSECGVNPSIFTAEYSVTLLADKLEVIN
jgi:hypothetical protein